ncbi:MAG: AMP-binding protein [Actinobacteria bacterium]|nr:AMP-binding protein [Actinomycetota bacterium]
MRAPRFARIHDYVNHWAAHAPAREMAVMGDVRLTYAQLAEAIDAETAALWRHGLRPGERVAVLSRPRPEFFVSFLAIVSVGGIFQGLSPKSALGELAYQVDDAQPLLLICHGDDEVVGLGHELVGRVESAPRLLVTSELRAGAATPQAGGDAEQIAAARAAVGHRDPAAIVYTSGSTGRPKGALLPHIGFAACSVVQAARWLHGEGARMPCVEPINHVAAVGDASVAMLVAGGTVVYQEQFDAGELLEELIPRERIDFWYTDPAVLGLCSRSPAWPRADLSKIRRLCWSGGRAPLPLVRELRERVPLLGTSWGMTETVGSLTYTDDDADDATLSETIGKPDPAYPARVVTEDGRAAAPGESGELQVRGPHLMRGYWNREQATSDAFDADGWMRTGDLVMPWDDGNLQLVGRLSDMFKSGGENVYPREVELELEQHPGVAAAVVVPRRDDLWGEVGCAFVVTSDPSLDADALRGHLRARLARFKTPKSFEFVSELPMLDSGKVDRVRLRATAAAGEERT